MRIRSARADEVALLPPIELAAGQLFVAAGIGSTISAMPEAALEAARQRDGLLVATVDEAPVGFVVLDEIGGCGHVCEMDVHPDHGRRGIGAALLHAAIDWGRQRGLPAMTLTTYRDLPWNAPFYARHGFDVVPPTEWGEALAEVAVKEKVTPGSGRVVMRRALPSPGGPPADQ